MAEPKQEQLCQCDHPEEHHRGGIGSCGVYTRKDSGIVIPCSCFHFVPKDFKLQPGN